MVVLVVVVVLLVLVVGVGWVMDPASGSPRVGPESGEGGES